MQVYDTSRSQPDFPPGLNSKSNVVMFQHVDYSFSVYSIVFPFPVIIKFILRMKVIFVLVSLKINCLI